MLNNEVKYDYFEKIENKHKILIRYELDRRIYNHGQNFKNQFIENKIKISAYLINIFFYIYKRLKNRNHVFLQNCVFSSAYYNPQNQFKKSNLTFISTPWFNNRLPNSVNFFEYIKILNFQLDLSSKSFNYLISHKFQKKIDFIILLIQKSVKKNKPKAIFLANDVCFFEKVMIEIAKNEKIPTFLLLHGAAPRFGNLKVDNQTDFLVVFSELMKKKFIEFGFNENKILAFGHPLYSNKKISHLKFSLENILVINKPCPGVPIDMGEKFSGREYDTTKLQDKGNLILYLYQIESALKLIGVKSARLRIHPSESIKWYKSFINLGFYNIDKKVLDTSLNESTLVIGPSSSLLIDALFSSVNYLIYEPTYFDGLDILNLPIGHPFDGSDKRVPVAKTEIELVKLINNKSKINLDFINDIVKPTFDTDLILKSIKNFK